MPVCRFVVFITFYCAFAHQGLFAQKTYQNPVLHADYSDPDVICQGNRFYMVASSFNAVPGLPILESVNLVDWHLIGYALQRLTPDSLFSKPAHGKGIWAPALRYHNRKFYIFYADPDQGIFMIQAASIKGPWSVPKLVRSGKGFIDPCPFWDTNGSVYMVHAFAGSRSGLKSVLVMQPLNSRADSCIGDPVLVYDGHGIDPTIEGPKLYQREGYYYIFAPAGGVEYGWQLALRSRNIFGPYERKVILKQGTTNVNGPHQGAWVTHPDGSNWFLHFQDKGAYGRIVHLQPLHWYKHWPYIGEKQGDSATGLPVQHDQRPRSIGMISGASNETDGDEMNDAAPSLLWQWQSNPQPQWGMAFPAKGLFRLNAVAQESNQRNLMNCGNLWLRKFPADSFQLTAKIQYSAGNAVEKAGFLVTGQSYAGLNIIRQDSSFVLVWMQCADQFADQPETSTELIRWNKMPDALYIRLTVKKGAQCFFNYSTDGVHFQPEELPFKATPGRWIGAKFGFFCNRYSKGNDSGYLDIDWVHIDSTF